MKGFLTASLIALALLTIVGIFAVLIWFANEWVVSSLVTITLLVWLSLWLMIAYGRSGVRSAAIGAVVAGAAYWLLALGPWFQTNIGSTLLTSRLLIWVEATHRQPDQRLAKNSTFTTLDLGANGLVTTLNGYIIDSGTVTMQPRYLVTSTSPPLPSLPPGISHFQAAGHWSLVWISGMAGGALALWLRRTGKSPASKGSAP
jgi:hypothetical protein